MQKATVGLENKEMWIRGHLRVSAQEQLILVFIALVNFHDQKALRQLGSHFWAGLNELVQNLAPTSPITADFQNDPFSASLGKFNRRD